MPVWADRQIDSGSDCLERNCLVTDMHGLHSLEEESLKDSVFLQVEVSELTLLLHLKELLEGLASLQALVSLLLQRVEVGQFRSRRGVLSRTCAVGHSQVPDLVHFCLVQVLTTKTTP